MIDQSLVRLSDNGDKKGGLKLFLPTRVVRSLGIQAGQLFQLTQDSHGILELKAIRVEVRATGGVPLPKDPFAPTWRSGNEVHATKDCPLLAGRTVFQGKIDSDRLANRRFCRHCWIQLPHDASEAGP